MINDLREKVSEIQDLDWVDDAFIDPDTAPEGELLIRIVVKENKIYSVCEELGFNVEDWDE